MKKPRRAPKPRKPGVIIPGGPMVPAPVPVAVQIKRHKAAARRKASGRVIPGGPMVPAGKKKTAGKPRKLALGEGVACCAAEALAASLRLAGHAVDDGDVLALYRLTADGPDAGATILATLEAASEYGLAEVKPLNFREVMPDAGPECRWRELPGLLPHETRAGLILGADLPGPHAVLATADAWWSWGEPYDPASFPGAVVEEAWQVTW